MRSQAATCLFESSRRAEAAVFRTRPNLKELNVDLSFYEPLYTSIVLANNNYIIQGIERDWNAIETKYIGLGDPYCEFKVVPRHIDRLEDSLVKDPSIIDRIIGRLIGRLVGFLVDEKPLVERPILGSDIHIHPVTHALGFPHLAGERYQMALRMGGARTGRAAGEGLAGAGLSGDEAVKRVLGLLEHCKVGAVSMGDTIRIRENCESSYTRVFSTKRKEPSCYFTTGFLNGLLSAVKNQHVREVKCIAMGDPYCEWEIV